MSGVIAVCGVLLMIEAAHAPAENAPASSDGSPAGPATADALPVKGDPSSMAWISAGLLLNAALINSLGFILSCALLFALAARGLRQSMGQATAIAQLVSDAAIGLAISAPVYWMFTKGLGRRCLKRRPRR